MNVDWSVYKQKISIVQAAAQIGYCIRPEKGHGRSVTLGQKTSQGNWGDQLVVSNYAQPGSDWYFNRDGSSTDRGDLISFILYRIDAFCAAFHLERTPGVGAKDWKAVDRVLRRLSGLPDLPTPEALKLTGGGDSVFSLDSYQVEDLNEQGFAYLTLGRQIDREVVRLFAPFIRSIAKKASKKRFYNVGFPYVKPGHSEVVNFEVRNYQYKGHCKGGNKSDACWVASLAKDSSLVERVYLFESAIDAMSYYELHRPELKNLRDKIVLVSLGGGVSRGQIIALQDAYPLADFFACFDNDEAGIRYDIVVSCYLADRSLQQSYGEKEVSFVCNDRSFSVERSRLTYSLFVRLSAIRANIYVRKPTPTGRSVTVNGEMKQEWFKDWNDCLKERRSARKENKPKKRWEGRKS